MSSQTVQHQEENHGRQKDSESQESPPTKPSAAPNSVDPPELDMMKLPVNVDLSKYSHVPNPYHWPMIALNLGLNFNGALLQITRSHFDPETRARSTRAMPVRPDDVFLLAYPKSGTHWLGEMISMLLKGAPQFGDQDKVGTMIEAKEDLTSLDSLPSPRFLNSHHYFALLPEGIAAKKAKIVHVIRNPRDTVVSWYFHIKNNSPTSEEFTFDMFLKGYMLDDYSSYRNQFCFLRQMFDFQRANPGHPIKHVHYEDLQENPVGVLTEIAQFLELSVGEGLVKDIAEACSFSNMKNMHGKRKVKNSRIIYRKGVVGDWKNVFTVAQNKRFEEFISAQLQKGGLDVKPHGV